MLQVTIPSDDTAFSEFVIEPYLDIKQGDIFGVEFYDFCPVQYLRSTNSACLEPEGVQYKIPDADRAFMYNAYGTDIYQGVIEGESVRFSNITDSDSALPYCRQYAVMANVIYQSMFQSKWLKKSRLI